MPVRPFNDSWIQTVTGEVFHLDFDPDDANQRRAVMMSINIWDVAYACARIQRFNGHAGEYEKVKVLDRDLQWTRAMLEQALYTDFHYSVAEHLVIGSYLVPPEFAFEFLMHDGPEAYYGDVTRPLKNRCPDYKWLLKIFERTAWADRWALPPEMSPIVKEIDNRLLWTEAQEMFGAVRVNWFGGESPEPIDPTPAFGFWSPATATRRFIERFDELTRDRPDLRTDLLGG